MCACYQVLFVRHTQWLMIQVVIALEIWLHFAREVQELMQPSAFPGPNPGWNCLMGDDRASRQLNLVSLKTFSGLWLTIVRSFFFFLRDCLKEWLCRPSCWYPYFSTSLGIFGHLTYWLRCRSSSAEPEWHFLSYNFAMLPTQENPGDWIKLDRCVPGLVCLLMDAQTNSAGNCLYRKK